jgi:hypothetical protein
MKHEVEFTAATLTYKCWGCGQTERMSMTRDEEDLFRQGITPIPPSGWSTWSRHKGEAGTKHSAICPTCSKSIETLFGPVGGQL